MIFSDHIFDETVHDNIHYHSAVYIVLRFWLCLFVGSSGAISLKSDRLCSVDECSEPNSPALQLRRTSFNEIAQTVDISVQTEVTNYTDSHECLLG